MLAAAPEHFADIRGSTDTEAVFALALTYGLTEDPIAALERTVNHIETAALERGIPSAVQASFGVSDGTTLWVHGSEAHGGRDRLWRIDSLDGRVLGSIDLPGFGAAGMATVGADAWVVTPGGQLIVVAAS